MNGTFRPEIPERTIVYVDGFNLYFGLREAKLDRFRWLDVHALALRVAQARHLVQTKYFTARISGPDAAKQRRQSIYLEALATRPEVKLIYGHYLANQKRCYSCGQLVSSYSEKMTDVNIAVEVMSDLLADHIDTAIIVSGDSDLTPVVRAARGLFPEKRMIVGFPPKRISLALKRAASGYFVIAEEVIKKSQLPREIWKPDGTRLVRPVRWD